MERLQGHEVVRTTGNGEASATDTEYSYKVASAEKPAAKVQGDGSSSLLGAGVRGDLSEEGTVR